MLKSFIEISLKQRIILLILSTMLLISGIYSFISVPIDAFPDVSTTQVKIILKAPGMAPEEVEARIVRPLEVELLGLPNQKGLRSISKYAIADITIDFEDDLDIYKARNMVSEKLSTIDLPEGVSGGLAPIVTPLSDMFMFTIEGDIDNTKKRELMDWQIRPALRNIKGVADVNILGHYSKAIVVVPEFENMSRLGISIKQLEETLKNNLKNDGAGRVDRDGESYLVKIQTGAKTLEEIANIPVITDTGYVRVGDFAKVIDSHRTRLGLVTKDGVGEDIQAIVLGLKGVNSKEVIQNLKTRLAELESTLPNGAYFDIFYDRSELTQKAVNTVFTTLLEAVVLIVVLLFLFLGDVRAALCVAMILPLSLSVAFVLMKYFGISANLMSLGGLVIAIGILVDSAVVVVENAYERLSHNHISPKLHVIYRSTKDISVSVFAGVLIIIVFFIPILTLEGLEGKFFIPLAQSIVFALLGSLFLSLSVIPVISSFVLKATPHKETYLVRFVTKIYEPMLEFCIKKFKLVFISSLCFLAFCLSLFGFIGSSFMPTLDEGTVVINTETTPSISLEQHKDILLHLEKDLMEKIPEIETIIGEIGSDELGLDPAGPNSSDIFISFKEKDEWRSGISLDDIRDEIRNISDDFKGMGITLGQPIDMRTSEMLTGSRGDLVIKVFGFDISTLNELSAKIDSIIEGIEGSSEVFTTLNAGVNYLNITPLRSVMANVGVPSDEFTQFLKSSLEGVWVENIPVGAMNIPVFIRQDDSLSHDITKLKSLNLSSISGNAVPISSIADIREVDGPVQVQRENAKRFATIRSNVLDRDLGGFVEEIKSKIASEIQLPEGYTITYGGQFENQQRANKRFAMVIPLSILAIFFILFFTFRSIPLALLILLNIPFAVTGGLLSLFVSGEYMSVPASVGFIALFGIAVLNGVVMVGYFLQLLNMGHSIDETIIMGAKRRLRPVLMTAAIAGLGLVPMLLSSGVGSEVQRPLAIVVMGGLVTSTGLTLLILPSLFKWVILKFGR